MKKYISVFIIAALIFSMFAGIGGTAYAAGVTLSVTPGVTEMVSGGSVDFSMYIENTSGAPIEGYIIKCDGAQVHSNDATVLGDGTVLSDSFSMNVPTEKLNVAMTFQLCDSAGSPISGATSAVTIKRTIDSTIGCTVSVKPTTLLDAGDVATFTFTIENKGNVKFTGVQVFAKELKSSGALNVARDLAPKETYKFEYEYNFTKAVTVKPRIEYKAEGLSETIKKELDPIELSLVVRDVKVSLSASNKNPNPGEEVTFTLVVKNDGTVPYTDLEVTWNGQKMDFPTTKLNPGDTNKEEYTLTFDSSQEVFFTITVKDHKSIKRPVNTNKINIQLPVDPNAINSNIGLSIEADREALTSAGIITFTGSVFNNSGYTLSDVKVTEAALGEVFSAAEMETGTRLSIDKTVDINETTTYSFVLTAKDRNGETYTVNHTPIMVTIQGAAEPSPTDPSEEAPVVSLPPVSTAGDPLLVWFIVAGVLILLIIGVGVTLVVLWKKGGSPSRRPSSSRNMARPSSSRPSSPRPSSPRPKTPLKSKYGKSKGRNYKDRNNF